MKSLFTHMHDHLLRNPNKYLGLAVFLKVMLIGLFVAIGLQTMQNIYAGDVCGNGFLALGEYCDDGNNIDGDGCSATCTVEYSQELLDHVQILIDNAGSSSEQAVGTFCKAYLYNMGSENMNSISTLFSLISNPMITLNNFPYTSYLMAKNYYELGDGAPALAYLNPILAPGLLDDPNYQIVLSQLTDKLNYYRYRFYRGKVIDYNLLDFITPLDGETYDMGIVHMCNSYYFPECGNGIAETGEECDGSDFSGQTCSDFGYNQGTLSCSPSCTVVTTACSNAHTGGGRTPDNCRPGSSLKGANAQGIDNSIDPNNGKKDRYDRDCRSPEMKACDEKPRICLGLQEKADVLSKLLDQFAGKIEVQTTTQKVTDNSYLVNFLEYMACKAESLNDKFIGSTAKGKPPVRNCSLIYRRPPGRDARISTNTTSNDNRTLLLNTINGMTDINKKNKFIARYNQILEVLSKWPKNLTPPTIMMPGGDDAPCIEIDPDTLESISPEQLPDIEVEVMCVDPMVELNID